ncbi:MAG: hypothetical protein JW940_03960 [Polyangiaceae bacterium]|nr:hypothetical protein [Polyangiaceae bacterium]
MLEHLERVLRAQAPNAAWTDATVDDARRLLDEPRFVGTLLAEVDCRSSLCKMVLAHSDADARREFWNSDFVIGGPWGLQSLGGPKRLRDGRAGSVLFFAHKGDLRPFQQVARSLRDETEARSRTRSEKTRY